MDNSEIIIEFLKIRYDRIKTLINLLIGYSITATIFVIGLYVQKQISAVVTAIIVLYAIFVVSLVYVVFSLSCEKLIRRAQHIIKEEK